MISVPYGDEDPANKVRPHGFYAEAAAVSCWCSEVNQLFRVGDRFYCETHKPRRDASADH